MIKYWYQKVQKQIWAGKKHWRLTYKIGKSLVNLFYPLAARFHRGLGTDPDSPIIVSLTSYPARIKTVWLTVASLLRQSVKPQRVILWLAREQFPDQKLPKNLTRLEQRGLEIRFCDDLKPHKKYYYTMRQFPEAFVVTADDDIFYPENHLKKLWNGHLLHKDAIVCLFFQKILVENGRIAPCKKWPVDRRIQNPGMLAVPIGANGVLYPPHSLHEEVFNKEALIATTLYTDDLWLRGMGILNHTPVFIPDLTCLAYFNIVATMKTGLYKVNTQENGRNDISWAAFMARYPQLEEEILRLAAPEEQTNP